MPNPSLTHYVEGAYNWVPWTSGKACFACEAHRSSPLRTIPADARSGRTGHGILERCMCLSTEEPGVIVTAWRLKSDTCFSWLAAIAAWVGYRPVDYSLHEHVASPRRRFCREGAAASAQTPVLNMSLQVGVSDRTHGSGTATHKILTAASVDIVPTTCDSKT